MNRIKIAIFFSLIVLIGLISISVFLANSGNKTNNIQENVKKPKIEETKVKINTSQMLNEAKNIPILTSEEADKNFELQSKMPYITKDFELGYSDLTGQYYVYKKTSKADAELSKFLENNEFTDLNNLLKEVNKSVQNTILEEENKIINEDRQNVSNTKINKQQKDVETLSKLIKIFSSFNSKISIGSDPEESSSVSGTIEQSGQQEINSDNITLDSIFNEAGTKIGTPPKILRGVMTRECSPLVSLPNEKIIEYSQPGNGIPLGHGCFKNSKGASGPMQFLPDVWLSYASAVNKFGGYTHTPYIANMRDSVYAAAWKLKRNSRTTDLNWTYEQVRRAVICYNAGCGRLNNPPSSTLRYLEAVWNMYKS